MVDPSFFQSGATLNLDEGKGVEECKFVSVGQLLIDAVFPRELILIGGIVIDGVPRISLPDRPLLVQFVAEGGTKNQLIEIRDVVPEPRVHFRISDKGLRD